MNAWLEASGIQCTRRCLKEWVWSQDDDDDSKRDNDRPQANIDDWRTYAHSIAEYKDETMDKERQIIEDTHQVYVSRKTMRSMVGRIERDVAGHAAGGVCYRVDGMDGRGSDRV